MIPKKLIIAGGGTGGHIFPGLAVADAWKNLGGHVVWVGSNLGKEKIYVPDAGYEIHIIAVSPMKGKGLLQKLKTLIQIPIAVYKGMRLLNTLKPDVVLGVGGYASFPMTIAAFLKKIPTAIAEQNSFAGLTNRILSRFAKKIFLSFEDDYQQFPSHKTTVVGNAIRSSIQPQPYSAQMQPFCILVTGGSLGAVALNDVFCQALDLLKDQWHKLSIVHQTGDVDFVKRQEFYAARPSLKAECHNFIRAMQTEYQKAHVIICRAGASTATEIALSGKPALFIPYPYAADDHQTKNAHYYVRRNAAWMVAQDQLQPADLAKRIENWMNHPEELKNMAKAMGETAKANANITIAKTLFTMSVNHV